MLTVDDKDKKIARLVTRLTESESKDLDEAIKEIGNRLKARFTVASLFRAFARCVIKAHKADKLGGGKKNLDEIIGRLGDAN